MERATRVEKQVIKSNHKFFSLLIDFCHKSKNLYNHANYIVRQAWIKEKKWIRYEQLCKLLKEEEAYPDFREMPTAQSAQQTLRLLDRNWKSFFASIKDWKNNKEKYTGRPKLPKYLKKEGNYILTLTNQNCKLKNNVVCFPKKFNGFMGTPKFVERSDFVSFQQVRFVPYPDKIVLEFVYQIKVPEPKKDNQRYVGIDLGVNNLATVGNNIGEKAFLIHGKQLKSINQWYNKRIAHYQKVNKQMNGRYRSKRMDRIAAKRNARMEDYMHKASRYIVKYCAKHNVHTIVIGKNKGWKQKVDMGEVANQRFVQIPFARLMEMIEYKARECGIAVILTEESYTSGTSFIDNEMPTKEYYNKARRVKRGLFLSDHGIEINADLNGAYQIMKKVFPIKWDRGCVLHPVVVNMD